jgi:hypothetical protein
MKRPSALIEAPPLYPAIGNSPDAVSDTASVRGAHPEGALTPMQRSRTKRFIADDAFALSWPETRLVALDAKTTNLPSALIATWLPASALGVLPSDARSTAVVFAVHAVAPRQVSRTKMFPCEPCVTKFFASEKNATNLPSALIAGAALAPSAGPPVAFTDATMGKAALLDIKLKFTEGEII